MSILHVNASTRGAESQSFAVADLFISNLQDKTGLTVDRYNLFEDKLPEFSKLAVGAKLAVFAGTEATEEQNTAWQEVKNVFDRFAAADTYVFNVPLWNNGIPYVLKQFIDIVTQPGLSFGFDMEKGYIGMMKGKRALVVHASGVYYEGVPATFGSDFSTPYLNDWFKLLGIDNVEHIYVSPTVVNPDFAKTKANAEAQARNLAAQWSESNK